MSIEIILGIVGILIGALLSYYFYRKSIQTKDPRYYYETFREIDKLPSGKTPNIEVFYKSEKVDRVYTTYLWIWNGGKLPIVNSDIPKDSRVTLLLSGDKNNATILDYQVAKVSREAINFTATQVGANTFTISFDFLDFGDGAILEIQHTCAFDIKLNLQGVILGAPSGFTIVPKESPMVLNLAVSRYSLDLFYQEERIFRKKSLRTKITSTLITLFGAIGVWATILIAYYLATSRTAIPLTVEPLILLAFTFIIAGYVLNEIWIKDYYPFPNSLEYDAEHR